MDGVERVEQLDDRRLRWNASVAGQKKEWLAEIVDQTPDQRIAWKSTEGAENAGAVLFRALGANETEVTLRLDADPEGPVETAGDALGFLKPTGAWRSRAFQGTCRAPPREWQGLAG